VLKNVQLNSLNWTLFFPKLSLDCCAIEKEIGINDKVNRRKSTLFLKYIDNEFELVIN
jgi:hypothetical protein